MEVGYGGDVCSEIRNERRVFCLLLLIFFTKEAETERKKKQTPKSQQTWPVFYSLDSAPLRMIIYHQSPSPDAVGRFRFPRRFPSPTRSFPRKIPSPPPFVIPLCRFRFLWRFQSPTHSFLRRRFRHPQDFDSFEDSRRPHIPSPKIPVTHTFLSPRF